MIPHRPNLLLSIRLYLGMSTPTHLPIAQGCFLATRRTKWLQQTVWPTKLKIFPM